MDEQKTLMKNRMQYLVLGICFLAAIGFFFYGLINNIQARKDRELSLKVRIELEECKAETLKQREYAAQANLEAEHQKRLAEEAFIKMLDSQRKEKKIK
jgi:hypothetical protein